MLSGSVSNRTRAAAGPAVYARYNVQLESEPVANELATLLRSCVPSE